MIKFDTSGFEQLNKRIDKMKQQLEIGKKMYFQFLIGHPDVDIQAKLKQKIQENVYNTDDPEYYKRTGNLLQATRVQIEDDRIVLYMDDDWLATTTNTDYSMETGSAPETHGSEGYSWAVEYDHLYNNQISHPYEREGSHYMSETFDEIVKEVRNGDKDVEYLLKPLFREWGK